MYSLRLYRFRLPVLFSVLLYYASPCSIHSSVAFWLPTMFLESHQSDFNILTSYTHKSLETFWCPLVPVTNRWVLKRHTIQCTLQLYLWLFACSLINYFSKQEYWKPFDVIFFVVWGVFEINCYLSESENFELGQIIVYNLKK